ncbi:hypothetical protein [Streptomyces indicus]|uniref:Lipoprotein n=1 Tax=Streptomyces indicus TaxID=417292 RepID=A0A1G9AW72_9ACTN|nr:hypothetical protein [Streptomyces indicus]SDK31576.1 hypothetical protein SAMN05421806_106189 [Streptomyces indicus]
MRVRRWGRTTVVAVALAAAVTGCSGGSGDGAGEEVAQVSEGKPSAESSAQQIESELEEYVGGMREWVACMRAAGVDLPDPDAKGQVEIDIPPKEWKSDPKYTGAQKNCSDQHPPLPETLEKSLQPEPTKEEVAKRRAYASCMQENGAPDFPDVGDDGYFVEENWDQASAGAKRAARTCDKSVYGVDNSTVVPKG